mgnify:CR=1 FL=1
MIELPEALTIARQMSEELKGKRIESGIRGNRSPFLDFAPTGMRTQLLTPAPVGFGDSQPELT